MYATLYRDKERYNRENLIDLDTLYKRPLQLRHYNSREKSLEKIKRERHKRDYLYYNYRKSRYQAKKYKAK